MSKYSVGLRNVGSYMVSGQPYITGSSVNAGEEIKIEFPYVTKNITIRIPQAPNTAALKEGGVYFLTTNETFTGQGSNGKIPPFGKDTSDWTWAFYWKSPTWNKNQIVSSIQTAPGDGSNIVGKIKFPNPVSSAGLIWQIVDPGVTTYDAYNTFNGVTLTNDRWYHILVTQKTGSTHLYIDGYTEPGGKIVQESSSSTDARFGWNSNALQIFTGSYDESIFFHTGMTHTEVNELYNGGEWYDPRRHSKAANVTCWWTMGDDHRDKSLASINDPGTTEDVIYDVIDSSEENINLYALGGTKVFNYVPGPFTSQTTGKLRVHMLGTTSSPHGANVFGNKHYREIQGYGSTITLPMKTKELYLSAVDAQTTFEVIAELTNIPTNSMYALTGSGIDE